MWWYPGEFFLLMQGGAAPADINQTDTLTVSDAVTATTVAAVPTESLTLSSETRTATVAVVATDSLAVSEVAFGALSSANQFATDQATVSDAVTQVTAAVVQADSATVTESVGAIPVTLVATDSASISSETCTATAAVNATDSLTITESISTTTTTGANISASDTLVLSESIVATLVAAAIESATISDTVVPVGQALVLDTLTVTDDGSIIAPYVGDASAGAMTLGPRVVIGRADGGAMTVTWDSTLITFDSTLTTWDGSYVGSLPAQGAEIAPKSQADLAIEELIAASLELA